MERLLVIDSSLLGHSTFMFAATLSGQLVAFFVQIYVAQQLGTTDYGIYAYAFAWVSLLSLFALLGNERLIFRYGSDYRQTDQAGLFNGLISWACRWSVGVAILLALGFVAVCRLVGWPPDHTFGVLLWTALAVPFFVTATLVDGMLRVSEAHVMASLTSRLLRPLFMGLIVLAMTWIVRDGLSPSVAVATNTIAIILSLSVALATVRPLLPAAPRLVTDEAQRTWIATSFAFGINAVALHLSMLVDILIMGVFHGPATVGTYGAVQRLMLVMSFAGVSVIAIIQPMIVRTARQGDKAALQGLVSGGTRLVCLASIVFGFPMLIWAGPILAIFGNGFEAGAIALRIHVVGAMAAAAMNLAGAVLGMTGHEKHATTVVVLGCLLTVVLCFVLIPSLGLVGAAAATAGGRVVWNVALLLAAWRRTGIWATPLALPRRGPRK
ncbi:MAG: oligosaccharide flippase family protein [Rhodospirillales bacterium]|nr:oligosaccharide flippase family protein [Rhodospirillales bacterium]